MGLALLVSALFMLLSVFVSLSCGKDSGFTPLLVSCIITLIVGLFPFIFVKGYQPISLKDGYVIIVLSWLLSFIFGMMPYVMWGGEFSLSNAWFESVSGFTTTGATILRDIEALPQSLLFWRSSTHFIGGLGVVVFLLLVIPSASAFRTRLTKMEVSSLSKEGYRLQSRKMVLVISGVYLGLFILAACSLMLAGMPFLDAVNHAFSVCATGGFSTKNASVAYFDSPLINVILLLFMVLATVNFALIFTCIVRRSARPFFRSHAVRFYLTSILVMSAIVVLSLMLQGGYASWGRALLDGFCTVASYVTTTGFGFADNRHWPFLAGIVLMYASIQCGCAGSTSSGIKVDRMMVVLRSVKRQIHLNLHPDGVRRIKMGKDYIPDEQVLTLVLYIVLYFVIIMVSTVLLLMCGVEGIEAISGSIASIGNVGPGLGAISIAGNYAMMPVAAKVIFTLDMFLGRVEIYPILITISLIFNKER